MKRALTFVVWVVGFALIAPRLGWWHPDYYLRYGPGSEALTVLTIFSAIGAVVVWFMTTILLRWERSRENQQRD